MLPPRRCTQTVKRMFPIICAASSLPPKEEREAKFGSCVRYQKNRSVAPKPQGRRLQPAPVTRTSTCRSPSAYFPRSCSQGSALLTGWLCLSASQSSLSEPEGTFAWSVHPIAGLRGVLRGERSLLHCAAMLTNAAHVLPAWCSRIGLASRSSFPGSCPSPAPASIAVVINHPPALVELDYEAI